MILPISCLGDFCSCGEIIIHDIISGITGEIKMRVQFERTIIEKVIFVEEGYPFILPNIFNENYDHLVTFHYNNQVLNGVQYELKIVSCVQLDEPIESEYDLSEYLSLEYN